MEHAEDANEPDDLVDVLHVDEPDNEDDHGTSEMLANLYVAVQEDGEQPRFAKVFEDAKHALCPGSV